MLDLGAILHGLTAHELAALCQTHVTTARRWLRRRSLPPAIARALALLRCGELGAVSSRWSGWALRDGVLISPEGACFAPGEVRAGPLHLATVRELQRQVAAVTVTVESAPERAARVAAIAALQNALADAMASALALAGELTPGEQTRVFDQLNSTQHRRERAALPFPPPTK